VPVEAEIRMQVAADEEGSSSQSAVKPARREALETNAIRLLVVVAFLVAWQLVSGPILPRYAISRPTDVARSLGQLLSSSAGWGDIRTTAFEVALGFLIGTGIGTVGGLVLGTFRYAGRVLEPLIAAFNGIPKVALAPLFLLFFGIGDISKIAIASTSVAFIMFYNLYLGLRTIRKELEDTVLVMGGKRHHVLTYVTLPSLTSPFIAGLKTSGPLAIIGVIIGEFIASFNGVGHLLFVDSNNLDASGVFAGIIVLVIMALILNGMLSLLDRTVERRLGLQPRR